MTVYDNAADPLDGGAGPPHDGDMVARIAKLEEAFQGIAVSLALINEKLAHLPSKSDVTELAGQVGALDARLDGRISALDAKLGGQVSTMDAKLSGRSDTLDAKIARLITLPRLATTITVAVAVLGAFLTVLPWVRRQMGI